MPLTPEQVAAYDSIEAAITAFDDLLKKDAPDGEFRNGWVLIINTSTFMDTGDEDEDEQDMGSVFRAYTKRGQLPALTRGIVELYRDRFVNGSNNVD